jgi:hypothetical protein
MDKSVFKKLVVGDVIRYRGEDHVIGLVEHDYDYTTQPPTQFTWQVHSTTGYSLRDDDDWLGEVRLVTRDPRAKWVWVHEQMLGTDGLHDAVIMTCVVQGLVTTSLLEDEEKLEAIERLLDEAKEYVRLDPETFYGPVNAKAREEFYGAMYDLIKTYEIAGIITED